MKISQYFNINKTQAELDFVDIDFDLDTPLFLDPFFLSIRRDRWSMDASSTIRSFFREVIRLIQNDEIDAGKNLFLYLHEPNSTCLGLSKGNPNGRGVGSTNTNDIFDSIVNSRAIQTGLVTDIEDNILFVDNFGKDKLSDMTTNIIRRHLIEYTKAQCLLHNIDLMHASPTGFYWDRKSIQWEQSYEQALVINNRKILLVPKGIVSYSKAYVPDKYYNHYVLNFMVNEHLRMNSALVQRRVDGTKYVTKKALKEENPLSKQFLIDFSRRNPRVLQKFKNNVKIDSISNLELSDINIDFLKMGLIDQLNAVAPGSQNAGEYHELIMGILDLLFYPHLIYPQKELEIHDGRKRIDINFDNAANNGVFFRLQNNMRLPCQYIMVECKNYSSDPLNPELDQLSGRFSPNRGMVGFLVCRTIDNMVRFINRCRDTYRDQRGLIIPLVDDDIKLMLQNYDGFNFNFLDGFLSDRIRNIAAV